MMNLPKLFNFVAFNPKPFFGFSRSPLLSFQPFSLVNSKQLKIGNRTFSNASEDKYTILFYDYVPNIVEKRAPHVIFSFFFSKILKL